MQISVEDVERVLFWEEWLRDEGVEVGGEERERVSERARVKRMPGKMGVVQAVVS